VSVLEEPQIQIFGKANGAVATESPRGKYAKLHTVAASNNRVHPMRSLYYCLFVPHTYGVVLHAHSIRGELHIQRNASRKVATV